MNWLSALTPGATARPAPGPRTGEKHAPGAGRRFMMPQETYDAIAIMLADCWPYSFIAAATGISKSGIGKIAALIRSGRAPVSALRVQQ